MFAILFSLILSANAMSCKQIAYNKQFWDQFQIKSILNTPSSYNVYGGEKVCFTCPFSSKMFSEFYEIESKRSNTPLPRTSILHRIDVNSFFKPISQ